MENESPEALRDRVNYCRNKLNEIPVKSARFYFTRKYMEYNKDQARLDNLWYVKITDEDFTKKLESFTRQQELKSK